jgi:hypothetical protein
MNLNVLESPPLCSLSFMVGREERGQGSLSPATWLWTATTRADHFYFVTRGESRTGSV